MRALCNVVLAVRKWQPCLYLLNVRRRVRAMTLSLDNTPEYISNILLFLPTFAAPAWMGSKSIDRVPYCISRALFLDLALLC